MAKQNRGKVFVFTAPLFKIEPSTSKAGKGLERKTLGTKRKCFPWKVSQFEVDLETRKSPRKANRIPFTENKPVCSDEQVSGSEEVSEINLDYDLGEIRHSLLAYLDDTFTENSTCYGHVDAGQGFMSRTNSDNESLTLLKKTSCVTGKTTQQEFDHILEQSQKLLEESEGFLEMTLTESGNSQNNSTQKDLASSDFSNLSSVEESTSSEQKSSYNFTKLCNCTKHLSKVNVFAAVLHVNPAKEILVKSGVSSGHYVRVSSILVGDPSKEYFKLTFWRKAAGWVTSLIAGDVVVVMNLKIDVWQQECYGQNMFDTTLVKLARDGFVKVPPRWLTFVSKEEAKSLLNWMRYRHPYLDEEKPLPLCKEVMWQTMPHLTANTLIHYRAKIVKVLTYNGFKGSYMFGSKKVNKVMALAIDSNTSEEVPIFLWGSQANWRYDLKAKIGQVWDFTNLSVECRGVHDDFILHTTPQSTKSTAMANLDPSVVPRLGGTEHAFSSITELLKANCCGRVSVCAYIAKISMDDAALVSTNCKVTSIDGKADLHAITEFFSQLVYLGCKSCLRALKQDQNGIYTHCLHCLNTSPTVHKFGVMYCFKACRIQFSDSSAAIVAMTGHRAMKKLVKSFEPQDLLEGLRSRELFDHFSHIFSAGCNFRLRVSLNCQTNLDENGFVVRQCFEFIDVHV